MIKKRYIMIFFIIISFHSIYPEKFQFDINLGYGGYTVPGYWNPLNIKINQEIKNGRIEIERKNNSDNLPKDIFPYNKNKTIEYPVLFDENINSITIRLFSENDLLIERSLKIGEKIFPGHIILTNNMNSIIQQSIAHSLFPEEPIRVISINLEDLSSIGLNYDCVSAIVLSDPGITLTPAQINALKYWIAGGGQLVIFNLLPDPDSIINKLDGKIIPEDNYTKIESGYGKIFAFYEDAISSKLAGKSNEWQNLLNLKPYVNNPRLRPAKIFKSGNYINIVKNNYSNLKKILLISFVIWTLFFLTLLFFTKKNILILSLFTLLTLIAFIPLGTYIKQKWQGGAFYYNKMVILPGNNGLLINTKIWFPFAYKEDYYLSGINLELGISERAFLNPKNNKSNIIIHNINKPEYALQNKINDYIDIVSYQPFDIIKDEFLKNILPEKNNDNIYDIQGINFQKKENLVLIKGKNQDIEWWTWNITVNRWIKEKSNPEWLNNDLEWIIQLKKSKLDTDWLIGFDSFRGINIKLQDELCSRVLWILPVKS